MEKQDMFLGSAVIATAASIWMLWPFADAILWAVFTAYFLHYFADYLDARINNRTITTGIMILLLIGFVAGLSFMVITSTNSEQINMVASKFSGILSATIDQFIAVFDLPETLGTDLKDAVRGITTLSSDRIIKMVGELPLLIINILIYFVVAAFLLKDGKQFKNKLFRTIQELPEEYRDVAISVVTSIDYLFRGVFLTYLVVALTVGAFATAGFYLMGVDFYWGWGLIIGLFAFFPVVSAPMVYVPLSLLYISLDEFWLGILILVYGIVVLNTLPEVLLRPYLAARQTKEHPVLLFIGFIVGPLIMGLKGVILGPMILVITKNLLTMKYTEATEPGIEAMALE